MRLVILGGGGFRVPLVHQSLLDDPDRLVDELVLHDVDPARLRAIVAVLEQQGTGPAVRTTASLPDALRGADIVFSAIRVGGLAGRGLDERIALGHGILGQETVGAGGICYALRTVPVVMDIARQIADLAPDAWVINFTNPAGLVTEAMSTVLGDRVIGICDSPVGLCRRVAAALGVPVETAWFDYAGLNHLGWLRAVLVDGRDRLPDLLADEAALTSFEEGKLFGATWLRSLGAIPNEYLHHYYFARETLAQMAGQRLTRGEFLRDQQRAFYTTAAADPGAALRAWHATRDEREHTYLRESRAVANAGDRAATDLQGGGYEQVALSLMAAVGANRAGALILNVRNGTAVSGMDSDAVVEVPCTVDASGAHPIAVGAMAEHCLGLMHQVKAVERATIRAALNRDRSDALLAMTSHPLVDSVTIADKMLDSYAEAFPQLTYLRRA